MSLTSPKAEGADARKLPNSLIEKMNLADWLWSYP